MLDLLNTEIAFKHKTNKEIQRSYAIFSLLGFKSLNFIGMKLTNFALKFGFPISPFLKMSVFRQFCGGETIEECSHSIKRLAKANIFTCLDYAVEGCSSKQGFNQACSNILETIEFASKLDFVDAVPVKVTAIADSGLLERVSKGEILSEESDNDWNDVHERIHKLCEACVHYNTKLLIDAEESWIQNAIDELAEKCMKKFNQQQPIIFTTLQMYRIDRMDYLKRLFEISKSEEWIPGVKLVRGAYMEKERKRAHQLGHPSPIQPDYQATNNNFNEALEFCLQNASRLSTYIATHNEDSCLLGVELMKKLNLENFHTHINFAQLFGMSDHISFNLADKGFRVTKYMPYGPVNKVIPYLSRRAEENSSVDGQMGRELKLLKTELKRRNQ